MPVPRLFYGGSDGKLLSATGTSYLDDAATFDVLARTNRIAPAGPGGECAFFTLYLTTTRFDPGPDIRLLVTPIVDGAALAVRELNLSGAVDAAANPKGLAEVNEISLMEAYMVNDAAQLMNAPRGSAIEFLITTAAADVPLDLVELSVAEVEYEVVREGRLPGVNAPGANA
jgi:hypothetical protein